MTRIALTCGALYGLLAVALGAFGAHGLRAQVNPGLLATWSTAADYLAIHALALLAAGLMAVQRPGSRLLMAATWCFILGAAVFSVTLFLRVLTGVPAWAAITPFGGATLILGWALLAAGAWAAFAPGRPG